LGACLSLDNAARNRFGRAHLSVDTSFRSRSISAARFTKDQAMKKSLATVVLLLGLAAGTPLAAQAAQIATAPTYPSSLQGTPSENEALKAYQDNINPSVTVPTTGPYDQRDRYTAPNGYQLPGYGRLPPS
jgi:hypothetical protein